MRVCAEITEVYDTMSCLPIVSDRAATEESKYFKLGWQPHELTQNTCFYSFYSSFCTVMEWNLRYDTFPCFMLLEWNQGEI